MEPGSVRSFRYGPAPGRVSRWLESSEPRGDNARVSETSAVREAFVELWARMGAFWGVTPTTARVLGWLLSKDGAQSADDIMDGLGLSRGAVSMAARELREWGLVH